MVITSRQNAFIKSVRALSSAKERRAQGVHLIEGEKLLGEAIVSGMRLTAVLAEEGYACPALPADTAVYETARDILVSCSQCATPQGVLATVETPDLTPPDAYPAGLGLVLDCVQDPGNVGTILRTADAMGAAFVLASPDTADLFSPKAVRAAMGSTYHLPVYTGDLVRELPRLAAQGFLCVCGHLAGQETLPPLPACVALVIGNEGNGVSDEHAALCVKYRLPMPGRAESLNASVAAGILLYELSSRMRGGNT